MNEVAGEKGDEGDDRTGGQRRREKHRQCVAAPQAEAEDLSNSAEAQAVLRVNRVYLGCRLALDELPNQEAANQSRRSCDKKERAPTPATGDCSGGRNAKNGRREVGRREYPHGAPPPVVAEVVRSVRGCRRDNRTGGDSGKKPRKQECLKGGTGEGAGAGDRKADQTCLDEPLSSVMVRQITEEQREHGRGNRIHGDDTGGMTGRDSECRGEQRQQRRNHLVVDFTEKADAEEQQQNECRAGWILCHSMNQGQRGHKTQGTYSIEDMPGEGLSASRRCAEGTLFHLQSVLKSIPFLRIRFKCKKDLWRGSDYEG